HSEPHVASQMVSQQLAGHRVEVLDEEADWVRARGADAYEGWMHIGFLARSPRGAARQSRQTSRVSLGCITATADGVRRSLPPLSNPPPEETLSSGDAVESNRLGERFPADSRAIVKSAQEFFSATSYLWGGVTPWGADCFGLVQTTFALHGIQLPRDAWQQAETGTDAEPDVGELEPADLL